MFTKIGKLWEEVTKLDKETSRQISFRCGRVKVATKYMDSINTVIQVCCKDRIFPVRVCEEQVMVSKVVNVACMCTMHTVIPTIITVVRRASRPYWGLFSHHLNPSPQPCMGYLWRNQARPNSKIARFLDLRKLLLQQKEAGEEGMLGINRRD